MSAVVPCPWVRASLLVRVVMSTRSYGNDRSFRKDGNVSNVTLAGATVTDRPGVIVLS